jgi:hypothetical protein
MLRIHPRDRCERFVDQLMTELTPCVDVIGLSLRRRIRIRNTKKTLGTNDLHESDCLNDRHLIHGWLLRLWRMKGRRDHFKIRE